MGVVHLPPDSANSPQRLSPCWSGRGCRNNSLKQYAGAPAVTRIKVVLGQLHLPGTDFIDALRAHNRKGSFGQFGRRFGSPAQPGAMRPGVKGVEVTSGCPCGDKMARPLFYVIGEIGQTAVQMRPFARSES